MPLKLVPRPRLEKKMSGWDSNSRHPCHKPRVCFLRQSVTSEQNIVNLQHQNLVQVCNFFDGSKLNALFRAVASTTRDLTNGSNNMMTFFFCMISKCITRHYFQSHTVRQTTETPLNYGQRDQSTSSLLCSDVTFLTTGEKDLDSS